MEWPLVRERLRREWRIGHWSIVNGHLSLKRGMEAMVAGGILRQLLGKTQSGLRFACREIAQLIGRRPEVSFERRTISGERISKL
jgi:hypothetical protein